MSIRDNLRRVRERIARAAERVGRSAEEVKLVGVTKYVTAAEASELLAAGCTDLGESRPQELWTKAAALSSASERAGSSSTPAPARWHLVGHLQRNKVRRTLPLVTLIHSVDSERLLAAIDQERAATSPPAPPQRVLLEVNTSGESTKHGLAPDAVEPLLSAAPRFSRVAVCGLMTMAAVGGGPEVAARNFATLRELAHRLRPNLPDGVRLDELSMGMSGDFEVAIAEGATIVRVGTALWK